MILCVDVGNSRTKLGLCTPVADGLPKCVQFEAVGNRASDGNHGPVENLVDTLTRFATGVTSAVLAGSDGPLRDALANRWPADIPQPLVVTSWKQIGPDPDVNAPETVGIDRLLNAAGACAVTDHDVVVVDAGTATTVDLVTDGVFRGGAILPGLRLAAQSLHDYTAALPLIDSRELDIDEIAMPGRSTAEAISAGVLFGQIGAIRELIGRCTETRPSRPKVILTGGAAGQLAVAFPGCMVLPRLTVRAMATLG